MTEITLHKQENEIYLRIEGHAEYSTGGDDIVCAACSTLSGTFATMISNMDVNSNIRFESGLTEIRIEPEEHREEIMRYLDFVMLGFELLEQQYPGYVVIVEHL